MTTAPGPRGPCADGSGMETAIAAPLSHSKLVRATGVVHRSETFAAISPLLSHVDKLWALHNSPIRHLLKQRADRYTSHTAPVCWPQG